MAEMVVFSGENSGTYSVSSVDVPNKIFTINEVFPNFTMPDSIERFTVLGSQILITLTGT